MRKLHVSNRSEKLGIRGIVDETAEDSRRGLPEGFGMPTLALNQTSRYSCALIKRREPRAAREPVAKHDSL